LILFCAKSGSPVVGGKKRGPGRREKKKKQNKKSEGGKLCVNAGGEACSSMNRTGGECEKKKEGREGRETG